MDKTNQNIKAIKSNINISHQTQAEYIAFHDQVETELENQDDEQLLTQSKKLFKPKTPLEKKKKILFLLAHSGSLEGLNILRQYLVKSEKELETWTILCLNECQMFLESDILEEDRQLIISPAGGQNQRLRFYYVITTKDSQPLTQENKDKINKMVGQESKDLYCVAEEIEFGDNYVLLSILLHMDVAPALLIENILDYLNGPGDMMRDDYLVCNTGKPKQEEIERYLNSFNSSDDATTNQ